jgi:transcriptional regulator with XRE-family HTH domain
MNRHTWFESNLKTDKERRLFEQERLILDATENVFALMESNEVSKAELARRLGRTRAYITQILSGARNMTLRTLADVLFACGARARIRTEPLEYDSIVVAASPQRVDVDLAPSVWTRSVHTMCADLQRVLDYKTVEDSESVQYELGDLEIAPPVQAEDDKGLAA